MKFRLTLLPVLAAVLLSACVFPLQPVSPDPVAPVSASPSPEISPSPLPEPAPLPLDNSSSPLPDVVQMPLPEELAAPRIDEPRLAVFWYAMADAHVYDLREVFRPVLDRSGLPWREYDAENDRYRQLDQVREAVAGGWNLLAVQLVSPDSAGAADEILKAADGCPVIFFDRTPDAGALADSLNPADGTAGLICSDPADTGRVQGSMIGGFLTGHFSDADLNGDGSVTYTMLLKDPASRAELDCSRACAEVVDALLADAGFPALRYFDPQSSVPYQADPSAQWPSDAANAILQTHLAADDGVELVIADSDELALGALTALQAAWCNLGDGGTPTVPLFGIGATSAARSAVSLGQMSGTVDLNADGYARALAAAVRGLADGRSLAGLFEELAESGEYSVPERPAVPMLRVMPVPVRKELFR